jgi:hypothetical protein
MASGRALGGQVGFLHSLRHLAQVVPYSARHHLVRVVDVRFQSGSNHNKRDDHLRLTQNSRQRRRWDNMVHSVEGH